MNAKKNISIQNINNSSDAAQLVEVLYQKMGDRWYAFSIMGEEVLVAPVPPEAAIEEILVKAPEIFHEVA